MTGKVRRELNSILSLTVSIAGGAIGSLGDNWRLALVALLLSATLWTVVTNDQNPPKVDVLPNDISVEAVNLPPGLGLFRPLDSVKVKISAPMDSWNRLSPSSFRAVADLSRSAQGMQEVSVRVDSADRQVRVLEVIPSKVPVRLDMVTEKTVPVRINLLESVPFGYSFKTPNATPAKVKVTGPEALVNQVEAAEADIKLEGAKVSISQSSQLTPRDAQGTAVEGVRIDPQTALAEVAIQQDLHYVTVPINPSVVGNVASGYWMAAVSVSPSTITIVGDLESLQTINFIFTESVDVGGAKSDIVRTVGLTVPQGGSVVGAQKATVRVTVAPTQGRRSYSVDPGFTGLLPDMQASSGSLDIVVSGPVPLLQSTEVSEITASVDLTGVITGTHKLTPKVSVPGGLRLVTVTPDQVDVQIRQTDFGGP
ncbi:MAG: CdaR family protein [Dehalococcoidia bacterium]|nr:CdaR family protein [Dehalococcoidia bacterium]